MTRLATTLGCALFALTAASAVQAVEPDDDFARPGFYIGANGVYGFDFFEEDVERVLGGLADVKDTGGFNVRAGYRFNSWFAAEGFYEYMVSWDIEIAGVPLFNQITQSMTGNAKFILPLKRFQPYIVLGIGAQYGDFDGPGSVVDQTNWGFLGRPGFGIDFYVTEHLVLNTEVAGSLAVRDLNSPTGDVTNIFYLSVGGGIQWRF